MKGRVVEQVPLDAGLNSFRWAAGPLSGWIWCEKKGFGASPFQWMLVVVLLVGGREVVS